MMAGNIIDILDRQICHMEYNDSATFAFTPQQVFDVVADIASYPEFLPGWKSVRIVETRGNTVKVEQQLGIAFFNWRFASKAVFEQPFHISITALDGPFQYLDIDWSFCPIAEGRTRVSLVIKSDSTPGPQHGFLQGLLTSSTHSLLNRFQERVTQLTMNSKE